METFYTNKRHIKVKLIFNPNSGDNSESPVQLMDVIKEMQSWRFIPETYMVKPEGDLGETVRSAVAQGLNMIVVCGGDGTVSAVARALTGLNAVLGIIPTGTRNNIAFSLGIPMDIPSATALLRTGRRIKLDVGMATCGETTTPFLEVCSIGLLSTIFASGDDIQHGKLLRIGDFLAALITSPPAKIHLLFEEGHEVDKLGHVLLISNMPYIMRRFKVSYDLCYKDGYLDILLFAGVSKLDLMGYAIKGQAADTPDDPRIQHFRVRRVDIDTDPLMPVMADGISLGEGKVSIEVQKFGLEVMTGRASSRVKLKSGEKYEK